MVIPADNLFVGVGCNPLQPQGETTFFISKTTLLKIEEEGPTWKFDDADYIREVIIAAEASFEDLKRKEYGDSFCFSYRPAGSRNGRPLRAGMVFVVYFRATIGGFKIFDWDWREEDHVNHGYPVG